MASVLLWVLAGCLALFSMLGSFPTFSVVLVSVADGTFAMAFVRAWDHDGSDAARAIVRLFSRALVSIIVMALAWAHHVDYWAIPDRLPDGMRHHLGAQASGVKAYHRYDLGTDRNSRMWLERLETDAGVADALVKSLDLVPGDPLPEWFFRMPPHAWPRAMPVGAQVFNDRPLGTDGWYPVSTYLLLDPVRGQAYFWCSSYSSHY